MVLHDGLMVGAGFLVGCFCPAIGRKVKALFVKDGNAVKAAAGQAVAQAGAQAENAAKKL